jgi:hypothetical protein
VLLLSQPQQNKLQQTHLVRQIPLRLMQVQTFVLGLQQLIYLQHVLTGTKVRLTTTTTLPAGLSLATDYYVIKLSDTTFSLATSYANAVAGTAINITDAGTGTHTVSWLLPRYTNGAGLNAIFFNPASTAMGAATPNLSLNYTNSSQTASRATPTVLPVGKTAASNSHHPLHRCDWCR